MFRSRSDPFGDVPQHCRPDRPSMFAARAPSFPWEEMSGGGIGPEQQPPATGARSTPLTELAQNAMCFVPATPPKAAAPKRPAALPAPRAAVAPLVEAAHRQADPPPQPAASTCSSPGPQQPTDQSRRRKMLRPRCASGPVAHAWAVKTPVDMHATVQGAVEAQGSLHRMEEHGTCTRRVYVPPNAPHVLPTATAYTPPPCAVAPLHRSRPRWQTTPSCWRCRPPSSRPSGRRVAAAEPREAELAELAEVASEVVAEMVAACCIADR